MRVMCSIRLCFFSVRFRNLGSRTEEVDVALIKSYGKSGCRGTKGGSPDGQPCRHGGEQFD